MSTLCALPVRGAARSQLFSEAAAQLARVLEAESHERTLCAALDTLQRWASRLDGTMPDLILDIFKVT